MGRAPGNRQTYCLPSPLPVLLGQTSVIPFILVLFGSRRLILVCHTKFITDKTSGYPNFFGVGTSGETALQEPPMGSLPSGLLEAHVHQVPLSRLWKWENKWIQVLLCIIAEVQKRTHICSVTRCPSLPPRKPLH